MRLLSTAETGQRISSIRCHPTEPVFFVSLAEHAEILAYSWDQNGQLSLLSRKHLTGEPIEKMTVSPDGALIAVVGVARNLEILKCTVEGRDVSICDGWAMRSPIEIRPASKQLPRKLREWEDGRRTEMVKKPRTYLNACFAPDGNSIIATSINDHSTHVFSTREKAMTTSFSECRRALTVHPEKKILATVDLDDVTSLMHFVYLADPLQFFELEIRLGIFCTSAIVFDWRGRQFAAVGGEKSFQVRVFDFPSCQLKFTKRRKVSAALVPDVDFFQEGWSWTDNVIWSGDCKSLWVPQPDGAIFEFDAGTGTKLTAVKEHAQRISSLDVHPRLPFAVTGSEEGRICLWEIPGLKKRLCPKNDQVTRNFANWLHGTIKK